MTTMNFETFQDIKHTPLRVFNRVVYMTNLLKDFGMGAVEAYITLFGESDRQQMFIMQQYIKQKGQDEARKSVTRDLEISYDPASPVHIAPAKTVRELNTLAD